MSWSARFEIKAGERDKGSIIESNVEVAHHYDQYVQAVLAAHNLIETGVFGDPEGRYGVNLTGHGNPDHVPTTGWGDDYVTININQLRSGKTYT